MGRRLTLLALMAAVALVTGDKPQPSTWNLKFSDPGRGAKFLNVPIQYGEWVPIDKARAIVEDVATRLSHQDTLIAPAPAEARIDTQEPTYVHVLRPPKNLGGPRTQKAPPKNPRHNSRRPPPPQHHHRRKDQLPVRFQQQRPGQKLPNNNRRNKKLPLPYPKNKQQKNYIRGQQGRRPPPFKTNSKVFKTKPQPFNPNTKASNGFLPSINPFKFFEQSPPKRPALTIPQPRPKFFRPEPTYLESLNAIQTIPAPDLSKVGPPIIEVDNSAEGDIIFGNPFTSNSDPLAGFVSLDFDGFSVGEREEKSFAKPKQQKTTNDPKQKLSVAIATKASSATDLVVALNNNQKDGEAFIITGKVPNGFTKVDIPFMDPSKHRGELPRVFIAPIGGPIPEGYKGKPLLSEPLALDKLRSEVTNDKFIPTTTETILLVQESKTDDEIPAVDKEEKLSVSLFGLNPLLRRKPGSAAKPDTKPTTTATPKLIQLNNAFKLKLQRQRPSLSQFYLKNKKKAEKLAEIAAKPLPTVAQSTTTTHFSSSDPKPALITTAGQSPTTTKKPTELKTTITVAQEPTVSEYVDTSTTTKLVPISSTTLAEPVQVSLHEEEQTTQFVPTIIPRQASTTTTSTTKTVTTITTVVVSTSSISTPSTTEATTTTTTQPISTTAKTTVEESTKRIRTTQDPFLKLESIVAQKQNELKSGGPPPYQGDLITGETLDEDDDAYNADTPKFDFPKPFRNRPRFRKYNSFSHVPGDKPGNFGKRIRSRKRPAFWNNARFGLGGFGIEPTVRPGLFKIKKRKPTSTEATSTTNDNVNTEEFKRKLKPYFENLYGALTREEEEEEEETNSKRFGLPRRRSSTPTPPITINAEIYEVNPRSRERITTARPKKRVTEPSQTTTTRSASELSTTLEDDYQPTTVVNDVTTTQQQLGLSPAESHDKNPPLEYQEYIPTPHVPEEYDPFGSRKETTTDQVHETADKHSITTATQTAEETEIPTEAPLTAQYVADETSTHNEQTTSVEKKEVLQGVGLDLNIENSINLVDQIYEESQQIETTWEEVRLGSSSQRPEESTTNGRLTSYEKDIDPQEHRQEEVYVTDRNTEVINEHGKQAHAHTDETFVEPNLDTYAGWKGSVQPLKPYVEIDRSVANNPIVRIEEIPITNPTDYGQPDIIYDTSKDGFDDDSDRLTFNYPVKFELIVPETTTIKEAPVTTTRAEDVTVTTEKATKRPKIGKTITTTEVEVEVPVTTEYHIPTTTAASPTIVTTTDGLEESATARIYPSPHKVPTDLWSAYQDSHETTHTPTTTDNKQETELGSGDYPEIEPLPEETPSETTTEGTDNDHESEESQTEGLSVASIMSYLMPANATGNSSDPPQLVEDKTIKSETVATDETTTAEPVEKREKVPKAFDFNLPAAQSVESGQIKIHSFGVEQIIPLRKPQIDHPFKKRTEKDGYVKKREEWIKNWVARKYNKGPKRPRLGPLTSTTIQEESDNPTTLQPEQEDKDTLIFFSPTIRPKQISLEPTVQPKTSRFNVDFDVTVRDGTVQKSKAPSVNELKSSLLEKYSSARQKVKNSLFHKVDKHQPPKKGVGLALGAGSGVPRGANVDLFRNYGGDKLSQAEFERQVLGVSTATEISVKSMICIKGRCFNADDMGKLLYK